MSVRPGAEAFRLEGSSKTAVLLVHGFTGSPGSMRPWGEYLHAQGYEVACPLLPGHGTRWQDMAKTTWQDWYGAVESAFDELREGMDAVFVAGLSMGGALSLRLAEERGDQVAGLLLVNPAVCRPQRLDVPVLMAVDKVRLLEPLTKVLAKLPGVRNDIKKPGQDEVAYAEVPLLSARELIRLQDTVRAELPKVRQPLVVFHSPEDHVVEPVSTETVMAKVTSPVRTQYLLEDSYHVATLDNDAEKIFAESHAFIKSLTPARRRATTGARTTSARTPSARAATGGTAPRTPKPRQRPATKPE